ncbi:MAG: hypothetical protein KKD35_04170 [Elusimicrobia bacterium]|nr:hypothetical protein [Elusimicrobiota bacterium]
MILSTEILLIVFIVFTNSINSQITIIASDTKNKFSDFRNTEKKSIGKNKNAIKLTEKVAFNRNMKLFLFFFTMNMLSTRNSNNKVYWIRELSQFFKI